MQISRKINIKKIVLAAAAILLFFMFITTIAKAVANKQITERDGYKVIRDVQGIEFQVNKEFSDYSTAVLEISKNIDFLDYQTYTYKNGKDTFLLFNMNSYIIIAKKGTCFDFQSIGVEKSFLENSLDGIWFSPRGKKPVIESSAEKYVVAVTAQVVITPLVYNDFIGTLTTLTKDGEEWTIFAGTVSKAPDAYVESIEYTISTVMSVDIEESAYQEYAIAGNISGDIPEKIDDNDSVYSDRVSAAEGNPLPDGIGNGDSGEPDDAGEEQGGDTFYIKETLKRQDLEQGKVYESSPYAMLDMGYAGIASIVNDNGGSYTEAYIRIDQLFSKEETEELVEEYISSGESYYLEMEAQDGMHFEAVSYSVMYLDAEPSYMNIKLCGLDGEDLRYRGVVYPHTTYDIYNRIESTDGWRSGYICFYAVPNGCTEYALSCGPEAGRENRYTAYFYIKSQK